MKKNKLINVAIIVMIPVGMFFLVQCLCLFVMGRSILASPLDSVIALRTVGVNILAGFALCLNMSSGRMDLSLGGQALVGLLIGGNIALGFGFGPLGVAVLSVAFSAFAGLLIGLLFVTLRIQAIVLGIGMALLFESISAAYSINGFQTFGHASLNILGNHWVILAVTAIVIVLMQILMLHSKFGIHYNCIRGNQQIAMSSGIKIFSNAVICYVLAGALIGLSAVLRVGFTGIQQPQTGMDSIAVAFGGFLPVLLAMFLQRWVNVFLGIPITVITFRILTMGMTTFNLSADASIVVSFGLLLVFMVIMSNMSIRKKKADFQKRAKEATALLPTEY